MPLRQARNYPVECSEYPLRQHIGKESHLVGLQPRSIWPNKWILLENSFVQPAISYLNAKTSLRSLLSVTLSMTSFNVLPLYVPPNVLLINFRRPVKKVSTCKVFPCAHIKLRWSTCPGEKLYKPQRDDLESENSKVPFIGPVHQAEEVVYLFMLLRYK